MTKRQLVDEILTLNKTAKPAFLARFAHDDLEEYLQHLLGLNKPVLTGNAGRYEKYFVSCPDVRAIEVPVPPALPQVTVAQEAELISRTLFEQPRVAPAEPVEEQVAEVQAAAEVQALAQEQQAQQEQAEPAAAREHDQPMVEDMHSDDGIADSESSEPAAVEEDHPADSLVSGGYQYTYTGDDTWDQDDQGAQDKDSQQAVLESPARPQPEAKVDEPDEQADEQETAEQETAEQQAVERQPVGASVSSGNQGSDKENSDSWLF